MKERAVIKRITFVKNEVHVATRLAEEFIKESGYSCGPTQVCPEKVAIFKGENIWISKWRNLSQEEEDSIDGLMFGDFRNGPVTVEIYR